MGYNKLRKDNLVNILANEVKGSPTTAKKYLSAMKKIILEELELNGSIYIHGFGEFYLTERLGTDAKRMDFGTGKVKVCYVPPSQVIRFKPSKTFKDDVNVRGFKVKEDSERRIKKDVELGVIKRPRKAIPTLEQDFVALLNKKMEKAEEKKNGETASGK